MNGIWNSYITNLIGGGGMINFTNDLDVDELFFRAGSFLWQLFGRGLMRPKSEQVKTVQAGSWQ